jgi:universal stress protein A
MRFACDLAPPGSTIYLLHVIPEGSEAGAPLYPSTLVLAVECLQDFVREQPVGGIKTEQIVRCGDPGEVIVKVAKEYAVNLIVMATHGHKGLTRLVLGSVTERVVREAGQPVLTVRPELTVQPKSA